MNFDFPPKKGSGIRPLLPGLSPDSVSLMSAMLEYDPDNRSSAGKALQHAYFEEPRTLEKHSLPHKMGLAEKSNTAASMNYLMRIAGQGRRQQVMKPLPEFAFQPHGPTFPMELPKLNVPGASKTVPFPTLKFQSVFPTPVNGGKLPIIPSVKYIDTKFDIHQHGKSMMKPYHLPSLERKGGGF